MLIGMYHNTLDKHKKIITTSLYSPNGKCRVIFCTNAFGMGVNFPDIRYVVHYGPPRNVEDFIQEIGQAGCDGKSAIAVLLFQGKHLRKCDKAIKQYASGEGIKCLRDAILVELGEAKSSSGHNCCLLCHQKCFSNENKACDKDIPLDIHDIIAEASNKSCLMTLNFLKNYLMNINRNLIMHPILTSYPQNAQQDSVKNCQRLNIFLVWNMFWTISLFLIGNMQLILLICVLKYLTGEMCGFAINN